MAVVKLSQIAAAPSAPAASDQFVAVRGGNTDLLFNGTQMQQAFGGGGGAGGVSVAAAVTPPVTIGSPYGVGFVVGGLLHFANVLAAGDGAAVIDLARVTCRQVEFMAMTLYLFNANPTASAFSDDSAPAIAAADVNKVLMGIGLSPQTQLGMHTVYATAVGAQIVAGAGNTDLWGVLITNDSLTHTLASNADVMVELTVTQD
jgi:hypothetical protein